jgi:hypothetical protein
MDSKLSEILERLPPKPPRSRLDPHAALIEELRRRGRTYREIARVLAEDCQVQSSRATYITSCGFEHERQSKQRQSKRSKIQPGHSVPAKSPRPRRLSAIRHRMGIRQTTLHTESRLRQRKTPQATSSGFHFDPTNHSG